MTASANDAHPYPIYNARYRLTFPILDADGDLVTAAATPDTELSQDSGTFADATNEATEIATSSGMYFLDLIATELDTRSTAIIVKTATAGAKTTPMVLYPRRLPVIRTGTAQAGAASTITLDTGASAVDDFYVGCWVNITNDLPVNALGQARMITDYVGSTKVATIEGTWGTNPSSSSTFEILLSEWALLLDPVRGLGSPTAIPGAAAEAAGGLYTRGTGAGQINQDANGRVDTRTAAMAADVVTAAAVAAGAIDAATFAAGAIDAAAIATGAIDADAIALSAADEILGSVSGTADSGSTTTVIDTERTEADTDYWKGSLILFTSGTLNGQTRLVTAFNAATDTLTFAPATTVAVATHTYRLIPAGRSDVHFWLGSLVNALVSGRIDASVGAMAADVVTAAAIANGAIDAATFAAGAIDAAAIATDAIGAAELADGAITALTFAAGAIDATAIAANAITSAKIATDAIGSAQLSQSAADKIIQAVSGTADSGSTTTIVDAERTEADTDYWAGSIVLMTSGPNVGQVRRISAFAPGTDTITVASAFTQAVAVGNTYIILRTSALEAPGAGATDWTASEKNQIRDALGVDGTKVAATGGQVQTIKTKTDQLVFTIANKVDASIQAAGDFAQAAADKVWASTTRTLTTIAAAVIEAATANKIADHVLRRTYANARTSADGDAVNFRSLLGAIGKLVNKWAISGTTLTVYQEDDLTATAPGGTQTITATAGADPITTLDTT